MKANRGRALLDIDGTLARSSGMSGQQPIPDATADALRRLANTGGVVLSTGQPIKYPRQVARMAGIKLSAAVVEHGCILYMEGERHLLIPQVELRAFQQALAVVAPIFVDAGASVRVNEATLNAFWNDARSFARAIEQDVAGQARAAIAALGGRTSRGVTLPDLNPVDRSGNLFPVGVGKGRGVKALERAGMRFKVAAGDSRGDWPLFKASSAGVVCWDEGFQPHPGLTARLTRRGLRHHVATQPHGYGFVEGLEQLGLL